MNMDFSKLTLTPRCKDIKIKTLKALVDLGLDPTLKLKGYTHYNDNYANGSRLFHIITNNYYVVQFLTDYYIKNGISIDVEDARGNTPLMNHMTYLLTRFRNGYTTTEINDATTGELRSLIQSGANPFHINNYGKDFFTENIPYYKNDDKFLDTLKTYVTTERDKYLNEKNKKHEIIKNINF